MKKIPINIKRQKALFNWACNQSSNRLASLLVNTISWKTMKEICESENLKIK